ncbi:unnamed protein product [Cochlearia groenlandica]
MDSTNELVVKVSYGGLLRRFKVPLNANGQLDFDMYGLKEKIVALFSLPVDSEFSMTYSDEDGDVVALVDDNDLFDVANQRLKFLKVNVESNTGMPTYSSEKQKGINDVLMTVPSSLRDTVSKVYMELASKAACSGTLVLGQMLDCISKLDHLLNPANAMHDGHYPVSIIEKGIDDVLMSVPSSLRGTILNAFRELVTKAIFSSNIVVGEMLDCISKLDQLLNPEESSPSSHASKPGSSGLSSRRDVPFACEMKDISKRTQTGEKTANLNQSTGVSGSNTSGHAPTSSGLATSFNECPFSGCTLKDSGLNPENIKKHESLACPSKKSNFDDDWISAVFHSGIGCDGCEALPITGPRFKSKVKEDYDLCNICFSATSNKGDYTRIGGILEQNPWLNHPVPRPPYGGLNFRFSRPKLARYSRFVLDVNVPDGTVVPPSSPFTKIWKMRNNGLLVWPHGTQIVWIGGDRFSNSLSVDLQIPAEGVPVNSEVDVKVDFVAPESPGRYISYWRMASSNGAKFGQRVWVLIHVNASLKDSVVNKFHGLDLNVLPEESFSSEFTGISMNEESAELDSSSVDLRTVKGADPEGEADESHVAEKDDLLVGETDEPVIPLTHTTSSSLSSYNVIELPNMPNGEALGDGSSSTEDIPVPLQVETERNDVEVTMLKGLEALGFFETDLNKEILRENEYDLEKSLDELCGVGDWDPILEELQEMGFCDDVTNKRLLRKNNGSIKGVVMDLLTGEKEA